jgi:hypothetical protein
VGSGQGPEHVEAAQPEAVAAEPVVLDGGFAMPFLGGGMGAGMGLGGIRRLPARQRAAALARLSAGNGNAALARLIAQETRIARQPATPAPAPGVSPPQPPPPGPAPTQDPDIAKTALELNGYPMDSLLSGLVGHGIGWVNVNREAIVHTPGVDPRRMALAIEAVLAGPNASDERLAAMMGEMQAMGLPDDQQDVVAKYCGAFGLRAPERINAYVKGANALKDTWGTMSAADRAEKLGQLAVAQLVDAGVPKPTKVELAPIGDDGGLWVRKDWLIQVSDRIGSLKNDVDTFVRAAATIYHEARHGEQDFLVLRALAGKGMSPEQIHSLYEAPMPVINEAANQKLPANDPRTEKALDIFKSSIVPGPYDDRPEERDAHGAGNTVADRLRGDPPPDRTSQLRDRSIPTVAGQVAGRKAIQRYSDLGPPIKTDPDAKVKIDVDTASEPEKIAEINRLLGHSGMEVIDGIQRIWYSFADLRATAAANADLFLKSAEKLPRLVRDDRFDPVREKFKAAVDAKVSANLENNRNYVLDEMKKLGISGDEKTQPAQASPEEEKKLRDVQLLAEQASKAQKAKAMLRQIPVGTTQAYARPNMENPPRIPTRYDPSGPPSGPNFQTEGKEGYRTWSDVDKEYKAAEAALQKILASSPAVYALVSQAEEGPMPQQQGQKTSDVAAANPADARSQIRPMMNAVLLKIEDAAGKVGNDLDYRDFIPVHDQLMQTAAFSGPIERAVIKADVEGHETMKMLRSLGLGALSAAAFILAEFATGGMATFLLVAGVAASAGNAALSIDDYLNKRTAAQAKSGDPRLDIVSDAQADSALVTAVIDTVFVFIDGAGAMIGRLAPSARAARSLLEAAESGAAKAATHGLAEAIAAGGEQAAKAIEKSVTEVGVQATAKASGKTAEQLAEQVGKDSELGKRILAASDLAAKEGGKGAEELAGKIAKLAEITDAAEKEKVLRAAIDQFGVVGTARKAGGWKAMTKGINLNGGVGTELMEWRESLVRQLEDYIAKESEGASKTVQTGTQRSAGSDIDVSTFGKDSSQNVAKAKEFIAGRAGCDSSELDKLLDLEVMADPTRMHLQDVVEGMTEETRRDISRAAARYEEQMIYARRIYKARAAGNEKAAQEAIKEAETLGIKPFEGYRPLSSSEITALNRKLDGLVEKLKTATEAEKKQLIEEIGQTQAQILSDNPFAYSTGGGIRLNVTERPEDIAKMPTVLTPTGKEIWPEMRYTAILAEGPHMDEAAAHLALSGQTPKEYVDAIKNIGKHGQRVTKSLGADVVESTMLDGLGDELGKWVTKAKDPDFVKEVANVEELKALRAKIADQLTRLKAAQDAGLAALRQQARLGDAMAPEVIEGINRWTSASAKLANAIDAVQMATPGIFEAIHQGAGVAATGKEDDTKKASVPDPQPNQSAAPAPAGVK